MIKRIQKHVFEKIQNNICLICLENIETTNLKDTVYFNCSCNFFYHKECVNNIQYCPICKHKVNKYNCSSNHINPYEINVYQHIKKCYDEYYNLSEYSINDKTKLNSSCSHNYNLIVQQLIKKFKYTPITTDTNGDINLFCINPQLKLKYCRNLQLKIIPNNVLLNSISPNILTLKSKSKSHKKSVSISNLVSYFNKYTYGLLELLNNMKMSNIFIFGLRLTVIYYLITQQHLQTNSQTLTNLKKILTYIPIDIRILGNENVHMKTKNSIFELLRNTFDEKNIQFIHNSMFTKIYIKQIDTCVRINNYMCDNVNDLHLKYTNSLKRIFLKLNPIQFYSLPDFNYIIQSRKFVTYVTNSIDEQLIEDVYIYSQLGFKIYLNKVIYEKMCINGINLSETTMDQLSERIKKNHKNDKMQHIVNVCTSDITNFKLKLDMFRIDTSNTMYQILTFINNINVYQLYSLYNSYVSKQSIANIKTKVFGDLFVYNVEINNVEIDFIREYFKLCEFLKNIFLNDVDQHQCINYVFDHQQFKYDYISNTLTLNVYTTHALKIEKTIDIVKINPFIIKDKHRVAIVYIYEQ